MGECSFNGYRSSFRYDIDICIGKIERGFDFRGDHFSPEELTVAKKTIENFIEKTSRLYEQKRSAVPAVTALAMYVNRWLRRATSGLIVKTPHGQSSGLRAVIAGAMIL
jgi:hypothetical protein